MTRTYDAASEGYREWLMEYMSPTTCPDVPGQAAEAGEPGGAGEGRLDRRFHRDADRARAADWCSSWEFDGARACRSPARVVDEIRNRLEFLCAVGLDYLSLERSAATLSGGEAQRIRLATQIGSKLRGVLYVLDEPSIGLHPRDNDRLLDTLTHLRDLGNTVLVVEHDAETIERADYVIDLGRARDGWAANWWRRARRRRSMRTPRFAHRAVSFGQRRDSDRRRSGGAGNGEVDRDTRRARAQSEERRRRVSAGHA